MGEYTFSDLSDGTYYILVLEDRDGDGIYEDDNCVGVYGSFNQPIPLNGEDKTQIDIGIDCT